MLILYRLKTAAQIKGGALVGVGRQAHNTELLRSAFQQLAHQRLAYMPSPRSPCDVHPAQPANVGPGVRVTGQTANGDQLPAIENAQKTFAWLVETVGAAVPLCNESREKPESFGDGFCFQYQDLSGQRREGAYRQTVR